MKKFKLTDETIQFRSTTLYRIKALKTFAHAEKGELGGWIEKESNLSQKGDCWISDEA